MDTSFHRVHTSAAGRFTGLSAVIGGPNDLPWVIHHDEQCEEQMGSLMHPPHLYLVTG